MSRARTACAVVVAFAAGLAAAHAATDGFEAFTLESARRLHALRTPALDRGLELELTDRGTSRLSGIPGQVLLVDFIYTSCATRCAALGSLYAQLEQALAAEIDSGAVRLLSVSFDPERDGPEALRAYRARHAPGARGWEIGRPAGAEATRAWLDAFGVVVIPDRLGGYTHNAAVHVVDAERRLVAIADPQDLGEIVRLARRTAGINVINVAKR